MENQPGLHLKRLSLAVENFDDFEGKKNPVGGLLSVFQGYT